MNIVGRFLIASGIIVSTLPAAFLLVGVLAPSEIHSDVESAVGAPAGRTWQILTDWHRLSGNGDPRTGMPAIGPRVLVGGGLPAPGKILRYAMPGGASWDQQITQWRPPVRFAFRNASSGRGGLLPGDVEMRFELTPFGPQRTQVDFQMSVTSHGTFNKAVAYLFGGALGTMKGYQKLILEELAKASLAKT
ncbi:MAG: hypothetical protein KGR26_01100 [Cyanobacteria bacterium REEB65]|nr:hypothetical protein [Cyanobacteria bacterium REEB65]